MKICGYFTESSAPPGCKLLSRQNQEEIERLKTKIDELEDKLLRVVNLAQATTDSRTNFKRIREIKRILG